MRNNYGDLFWITGLAGAGKSTIAQKLYCMLKEKNCNVVFLDGDNMREVLGVNAQYDLKARLELALVYSRLCRMLTDQGLDVICATVSMFPECWEWNRKNIPGYKEIYIRVPMEILIQRDQKQLYSRALKGETQQVMGIDLPFNEPNNPDIILENKGDSTPQLLAERILKLS